MPETGIDGNPVDPGTHLGFLFKPVEPFPDVNEHFLEYVPPLIVVSNVAAADPIDPVLVRFDCRFV
jgi:hypothetical protein